MAVGALTNGRGRRAKAMISMPLSDAALPRVVSVVSETYEVGAHKTLQIFDYVIDCWDG